MVIAVRNAAAWAEATLVVVGESANEIIVVGQSEMATTLAVFPMAAVAVNESLQYGAKVLIAF